MSKIISIFFAFLASEFFAMHRASNSNIENYFQFEINVSLTPFIDIHNVNVRTCVHMDVVVFTYVSINVCVLR